MHKYLPTILMLVLLNFCRQYTSAQSDVVMATQWNNRASYNPAFIARTDYLYLFTNIRNQWTGVPGAPRVLNVQLSEYFHSARSAFGIQFISDRIGATSAVNPMLTYAYRIAGKNNNALAFGLSAGVFSRTLNGSMLEADIITDPLLSYAWNRKTSPDLNAGIEYQNSHFILGLSSTHLFSLVLGGELLINSNHRYAYLIYRNDKGKILNYSTGLQIVNRNSLTIAEANISVRFKHLSRLIKSPLIKGEQESFDMGLTLRSSREAAIMCGVKISPYLRIGYAFADSFSSGYYRNGTHEVMLEYRIPSKSAATSTRCSSREFWYR